MYLLVAAELLRDCLFLDCALNLPRVVYFFNSDVEGWTVAAVFVCAAALLRQAFFAAAWLAFSGYAQRCGPRDFTLFVSVPPNTALSEVKEEIVHALTLNNNPVRSLKVVPVYAPDAYLAAVRLCREKKKELRRMEAQALGGSLKYVRQQRALRALVERLEDVVDVFAERSGQLAVRIAGAFVTFASPGDQQEGLRALRRNLPARLQTCKYRCRPAEPPEAYCWENFGASAQRNMLLQVAGGWTCFVLAVASGVGFYYFFDEQSALLAALGQHSSLLFALLLWLFAFCLNLAGRALLRELAGRERHARHANAVFSALAKVLPFLVLNSGFTALVAYAAATQAAWLNAFWDDLSAGTLVLLVLAGGVLEQLAFALLRPGQIALRLRRARVVAAMKRRRGANQMLQADLNALFEDPPFDLVELYCLCLRDLALALAFQPWLPLVSLAALLDLLLGVALHRGLLCAGRQRPPALDLGLTARVLSLFDLCLLLHALSLLVRYRISQASAPVALAVAVAVAAGNLALGALAWRVEPRAAKARARSYAEEWLGFERDYDRENPLTSGRATLEWLNAINAAAKTSVFAQRRGSFPFVARKSLAEQDALRSAARASRASHFALDDTCAELPFACPAQQRGSFPPPPGLRRGSLSPPAERGSYAAPVAGGPRDHQRRTPSLRGQTLAGLARDSCLTAQTDEGRPSLSFTATTRRPSHA